MPFIVGISDGDLEISTGRYAKKKRGIALSHSEDCAESHKCVEPIIEETHEMQRVGAFAQSWNQEITWY
jgi:hypothetical protein